MNLRTRFLALFLTGCMILSLAACSDGKEDDTAASPDVSDAAEPSDSTDTPDSAAPSDNTETESLLPADFVADPSVEDLYLATADIPGDFELFTVNGTPVSARMFLYWLAYSISEMENTFAAYYGMPLDWSEELGLSEYLMGDALNATLMYTLVPSKAAELGFELTQEQTDDFEALLQDAVTSMGGEEEYQEALRTLGLDQETYAAINIAPFYYDRLMTDLFTDRPTDADVEAYIADNDILMAKHILLMTVDSSTREPLEDSVIAEKKATAEDILKQLQESDDLSADFDALMHENSEDTGLAAYPDGYTFTSGEMVTEFEEGTRALEYGQISGLVESPYGYHIILRLNPDSEALREDCLTTLVAKQVNTWIAEAELVFTEEYENLNPQLFYEKFIAYQEAFSAQRAAAEAAETPSEE